MPCPDDLRRNRPVPTSFAEVVRCPYSSISAGSAASGSRRSSRALIGRSARPARAKIWRNWCRCSECRAAARAAGVRPRRRETAAPAVADGFSDQAVRLKISSALSLRRRRIVVCGVWYLVPEGGRLLPGRPMYDAPLAKYSDRPQRTHPGRVARSISNSLRNTSSTLPAHISSLGLSPAHTAGRDVSS